MAFEGKAINFLTSLSSINLFNTTMCTTCEEMASFRPLAFELEAKEICPYPTSLLPPLTTESDSSAKSDSFQLWPCMHYSSHFEGRK